MFVIRRINFQVHVYHVIDSLRAQDVANFSYSVYFKTIIVVYNATWFHGTLSHHFNLKHTLLRA